MDKAIHFGLLHCHSEHSIRDSAMKVERLVARAKELGAPAVALTDHGILMGIIEFMKACTDAGIKGIPGMEAYFLPSDHPDIVRAKLQHLILMAKNHDGYLAICNAVRDSYGNQINGVPVMNYEILEKNFGEGTPGHGNVIATSACVLGVLSSILLANESAKSAIPKLEKKRDKHMPVDDEFLDLLTDEEEAEAEIQKLIAKRAELTAATRVSITGLNRKLKAVEKGTKEYAETERQIEDAVVKKAAASEKLATVAARIAAARKRKTAISQKVRKRKEDIAKWEAENEKIQQLEAGLSSDKELHDSAKKAALWLRKIFGADNFYIELQYHGIQNEKLSMPKLAKIAEECGIPVVAANDAHYATNSKADIRARTLVAATRFNEIIPPDIEKAEGYGELYIKTDKELFAALCKILPKETAESAIRNIGVIADACNVVFPGGTHYPVFKGGIPGETADQRLRRLAEEGIVKYGSKWCKEYEARMNYELDIIGKMGYSDYLCIVQDFLEFGRLLRFVPDDRMNDVPYNIEKLKAWITENGWEQNVGYTIGPGRGSAAGSIVCYLCGITSIDPMKYDLLFERFLNPERVSMPDIDSDIHSEKREKVIDYVKHIYGKGAVCNIATKGTLAGKGAIRATGRVTNVPNVVVDEVARLIPTKPNAVIADAQEPLDEYCKTHPIAKGLIEDAKLMEGAATSYGMHAAGIIISDNDDVCKYVPLMQSDGLWVAQCNKEQAEHDCGTLKMDFLGLKNLDIITDCLRRIQQNKGIIIDMEKIPMDDKDVYRNIFAAGKTDSVFQFESNGMKSMLRQFKPDSIEDLILLVAAYRPGPMQYLQDVIDTKHGRKKPVYIAKGIEEILAPTYGKTIYQEQVMQILNRVAGFSLGEADVVRRAMSKKKLSILTDPKTNYHGRLVDGLVKAGASKKDAESFWTELLDFANYAFNKSHAACYAFVAYYTAWLKYHYPAEYLCSVMVRSDFEKIPALLNECKSFGFRILPPDINRSQAGFTNTEDSILFGLNDIKGVGNAGDAFVAERVAHGSFTHIKDLVGRMLTPPDGYPSPSIKPYETLIKAGAFDAFGERASLLGGIGELISLSKKAKAKSEDLIDRQSKLSALGKDAPEKERRKLIRSVENSEKALTKLQESIRDYSFPQIPNDLDTLLNDEYNLLGFYVSGNPLYKYELAIKNLNTKIDNIVLLSGMEDRTQATIVGIIKNIKELARKKDNQKFATFTLLDATGETTVKCFTEKYQRYSKDIYDGAVCCISGRVTVNEEFGETSISVDKLKPVKMISNEKILIQGSIFNWNNHMNEIKAYQDNNGLEVIFFDTMLNEIREANFKVSKKILKANIKELSISKK